MIDKKSPVPLYFQIQQEIEKILFDLKVGDKIPTEEEFAKLFNVSRPTIRQSLMVLESEGHIIKKRGLGTFVLTHKFDTGLTKIISLADQMKKQGLNFASKVICFDQRLTSHEITARLEVKQNSKIIYIERLRLIDKEPMYLTKGYIAPSICKKILNADLEHEAIFESIKKYCGIVTNRVERILEAIPASNNIAKLLNIEIGYPVNYLQTYAYSINGQIWGYFIDYFRSDKCRFTFAVEKGPFAISRLPAQFNDKVDIELINK